MEKKYNTNTLLREDIVETDKKQKYFLNLVMLLGALGFLTAGISSYVQYDIVPIIKAQKILFFPQGITMCFYGFLGTLLSINQIRILILNLGEGYNEFDKTKGTLKIFRKGLNGKNSDLNLTYQLNEIEAIKVEIKTEPFNTKQRIYVCLKGKNDLPLIQLDRPIKINELEEKASEIASFLKVPVKGI